MLKRSPSLTEQVKTHLKEQIVGGEFADGRIPSEFDLAQELGVSRTTIRDALSRLENEGSVFRRQGAGTFVNEPGLQIKSRLEEIWSYEAVLEAHGYQPTVTLLLVKNEVPKEEIQQLLDLKPGEKVTVIKKLFAEDHEPVVVTENLIPSRLFATMPDSDQYCLPVYRLLEDFCQERLNYYLSEIVPVKVGKRLAETLAVKPQSALLSFEETGYSDDNQPILWSKSIFRDDLLRFRLIRRNK